MSSALHYSLVVDMSTTGTLAPHLDKIGKQGGDLSKIKDTIGSIASGIGSLGSSLAGAFTGAVEAAAGVAASVAKIGAVGAVGAVAFGVKLNSELEQAQVSLAAIFNSQGMSNGMLGGMKDAQAVMKDMRKDAADLPGEFKDLMGIFRMAATPGFQAGGTIKQIENISANTMAFAASRGIQMDQAGRELGMLLQGRASAHNVLGNLMGLTGEEATKFNAAKPQDRLKKVETILKKEESSRDFFGGTFDAMSSTLLDNAKKFLGGATAGVFDRLKAAMETANAWFDKNEEKIMSFAEKIGERLSFAFEFGRRKIEEWTPAVLTFVETAYAKVSGIWERVAPMIEKVGEILKKALSDPATFDRIEGVLKLYAAVKIGGVVMPGIASAGSAALEAGAASGMGIAELAASAGVAAAAIGLLAVAVYGAIDIVTDSGNSLHGFAMQQIGETQKEFNHLVGTVSDSSGAFKRIADLLGADLLLSINLTVGALDLVVGSMTAFYEAIVFSAQSWLEWLHIIDTKLKTINEPADARGQYGGPDVSDSVFSLKTVTDHIDDAAKTQKKGVPGGGGTTIQKVEIVVSSNQDPSRIARAIDDRLADVSRNPTSSRFVRNWGAVRP